MIRPRTWRLSSGSDPMSAKSCVTPGLCDCGQGHSLPSAPPMACHCPSASQGQACPRPLGPPTLASLMSESYQLSVSWVPHPPCSSHLHTTFPHRRDHCSPSLLSGQQERCLRETVPTTPLATAAPAPGCAPVQLQPTHRPCGSLPTPACSLTSLCPPACFSRLPCPPPDPLPCTAPSGQSSWWSVLCSGSCSLVSPAPAVLLTRRWAPWAQGLCCVTSTVGPAVPGHSTGK